MSFVPDDKAILAWHFLPNTKCLKYPPHTPIEAGTTVKVELPLKICKHGLHGSKKPIDALKWAPGDIICRTLHYGEVDDSSEVDKLCSEYRTVVWMADASKVLRLFACDVAEGLLKKERESGREPHIDSWKAVEVSRRYANGEATLEELNLASRSAEYRSAYWAAYSMVSSMTYSMTYSMSSWLASKEESNFILESRLFELQNS